MPSIAGSKRRGFASGARSEAKPSGDRRPDSRRQGVASRRGQDVREAGLRPVPRGFVAALTLGAWTAACGQPDTPDAPELAETESAGYSTQGYSTQGYSTQGYSTQGYSTQGTQVASGADILGFRLQSLVEQDTIFGRAGVVDTATLSQGHVQVARSVVGESAPSPLPACSSPTSGTGRDCGWRTAGVGLCRPGTLVDLGTSADGTCSFDCAGDPILRVCPGRTACGRAQELVEGDDCRPTTSSPLSRCPAQRFTCPASGVFNVLVGSYGSASPASAPLRVRVAPGSPAGSWVVYPFYDWVSGTSLDACPSGVVGADRSCGYRVLGYGSCARGQSVTLTGPTTCSASYALRACAGSAPCDAPPPGGTSASFLGGATGMLRLLTRTYSCPSLSFVCPASASYVLLAGGVNSAVTSLTSQTGAAFQVSASSGVYPVALPSPYTPAAERSLEGLPIDAVTTSGAIIPMIMGRTLPELADRRGYDAATNAVARYVGSARRYEIFGPVTTGATVWKYEPRAGAWVGATSLCSTAADQVDDDGAAVSIPVQGGWDATGRPARTFELTSFPCAKGVVSKCYRWGYRAWDAATSDGMASLRSAHQMCTRMARADYCGDGRSWTQPNTLIDLWDERWPYDPYPWLGVDTCSPENRSLPNCRQRPASSYNLLGQGYDSSRPDVSMKFEAGWDQQGAVCLSHERWANINRVATAVNPYAPASMHPFLDCPNSRLYNPAYLEATRAHQTPSSLCAVTVAVTHAGPVTVEGFTDPRDGHCAVPTACDSLEGRCACDPTQPGNDQAWTQAMSAAGCQSQGVALGSGWTCKWLPGALDFGPDARLFNGSVGLDACAAPSTCATAYGP